MTDNSERYVPKEGDEVVIRFRTWTGIAELPCIWHSVEPAPSDSDRRRDGSE